MAERAGAMERVRRTKIARLDRAVRVDGGVGEVVAAPE
jgi:hypothetical protein